MNEDSEKMPWAVVAINRTTKRPFRVDYMDTNEQPSVNGVNNNMKVLLFIERKKNASNDMHLLDRGNNSWEETEILQKILFYESLKNMLQVKIPLFAGQNLGVVFTIYSDLQNVFLYCGKNKQINFLFLQSTGVRILKNQTKTKIPNQLKISKVLGLVFDFGLILIVVEV